MNRIVAAMILAACLGVCAPAFAKSLPPAPPTSVHDDTRALSEVARQAVQDQMTACRQAVNADVWFTAVTFLPEGMTLRVYVRELRQSWSPGRDAIVMAYDRATDSMGMSFSPGMWQRYSSMEIISLHQQSASIMADKSLVLEARLTKAIQGVLGKLKQLEEERKLSSQGFSAPHRSLAFTFVPSLVAGGFLLLGLGALARRKMAHAAWQSYFPAVQVGLRFGALHGGGTHAIHQPGRTE